MILATDTHYAPNSIRTAGVLFRDWTDVDPHAVEAMVHTQEVAYYVPGAFYLRELPLIVALLEKLSPQTFSTIVIDGYVYLDSNGRKGLGAHLFDALNGRVSVVGVAKQAFAGSSHAIKIHRGISRHPLYITAAGLPPQDAAKLIHSMSGPHRHPSLLKLADRLSRA